MTRHLLFVLLGWAALSSAAAAQTSPTEAAWTICRDEPRQSRAAAVASACTTLLEIAEIGADERAEALSHRATAHRVLRAYGLAIADYEAALRIDSSFAWAHAGLGASYRDMGNPRRAIGEYDIAIRLLDAELASATGSARREDLNARIAFGRHGRGLSYAWLDDNRRALPDFHAAARALPDEPEMSHNLCWTLAILGEGLDEARGACDSALRIRPGHAPTLDSRGLVSLKQGRFQEAWDDYDAAVRGSPRGAIWLYGRGIAALRLGRTAEGRADMEAALAISPDLGTIYAGYGIRP